MALHDNPLWILSHIRNSFIVSDSTANSQLLLTNDHKPYLSEVAKNQGVKDLKHFEKCLNPFGEDSDESDNELSKSVEIRPGNRLRPRCNTERKLEKLRLDRRKQNPAIRTVSWQESRESDSAANSNLDELFPKKVRNGFGTPKSDCNLKSSLLSQKMETSPQPVENPFADFSRHDAALKPPSESMTVRILVLKEFIEGRVHPHTLVKDVIGFICWKYVDEGRTPSLNNSGNLSNYSLYMADPDGSIDWELRPLEKSEPISKFGFTDYALVDIEDETDSTGSFSLDVKVTLPDGTYTVVKLPSKDITAQDLMDRVLSRHKIKEKPDGVVHTFYLEAKSYPEKPMEPLQSLHTVEDTEFFIVRQNSRRCTEFEPTDRTKLSGFYAMDATTYQEYRDIFFLTKIRSKMGVVLTISQDRFEVLPHQTPSGRLRAAAHSVPNEGSFSFEVIVACEITDKDEDDDTCTFRLVWEHKYNNYKKVYFEGGKDVVNEIYGKMSNLLQWHSSQARANYIVYKELKKRRRKTNFF